MRIAKLFAVLAVVLAACGDDELGEQPQVRLDGVLEYQRSGGFAGVEERLTIRPDGEAELVVAVAGVEEATSFTLPVDQLRALREAADEAGVEDLRSPRSPTCADCFVYEIAYRGNRVRRSQVEVHGRLSSLVAQLQRIVDSHRPLH